MSDRRQLKFVRNVPKPKRKRRRKVSSGENEYTLQPLVEMGLMSKGEFSEQQRMKLAHQGKALPGGRYPIRNVSDLKNAIQAVGRTPEPQRAKVKAWIVRRAKALGEQALIPDDWQISKRVLFDNTPPWAKAEIVKSFWNEALHPRDHHGRWRRIGEVSDHDEENYGGYSSDGDSMDINPMLRGHEMPYADPNDEEEMTRLHSIVDSMDRIAAAHELTQPLSVYRVAPVGELKEGHEITDHAFMSTSDAAGTATKYDEGGFTPMRIDLPKGFNAIPHAVMSPHASANGEIILPRGTKLRAVRNENGVWVMEPVISKNHFNPLEPRDWHGRWSIGGHGKRKHKDDLSPFPDGPPARTRRATGARTARKVTGAETPRPARAATRPATPAKKTTAPAPKKSAAPSRAASYVAGGTSSNGLYDDKAKTVTDRKSIPRVNRGGTHIMYDENKKPLVPRPYDDPGKAYYARNVDPNKRLTNERLKEIFEDPSKMTTDEKRMLTSAAGAKSLDGADKITVETSRGPRHLERYQVIGQLRSKLAPGSGDRSSTRQDEAARAKQAAKRRASGKVSSTQFGKIAKRITDDWSDNGETMPCVFCKKDVHHSGMSIETATPKALGGSYSNRGQTWPAHHDCNTQAGAYAQTDPVAYREEMLKKFRALPLKTRKRLPFVYEEYPELGKYPGTAAELERFMKEGPK